MDLNMGTVPNWLLVKKRHLFKTRLEFVIIFYFTKI